MRFFVTADTHFGHANILKYCDRPFRDLEHMDSELIRRFNERVSPEDTTLFLGDFCFKNSKGGKPGEGALSKSTNYASQLNGEKVFIQGNHDRHNSTKTPILATVLQFGGHLIGCTHDPAHFLVLAGDPKISFHLCGHVHQNWKHRWVGTNQDILQINVGVDVWGFHPVLLDEVLQYRAAVIRGRHA